MTESHDDDRPKSLSDPGLREQRCLQLTRPHIAPLARFVASLRVEAGPQACIPDFDPWDGGIEADVLFLLEAPGRRAVASGFISRNNPDETAKNFFELNRDAGISRRRTVTWNVVPWYIGTTTKIRAAKRSDIQHANDALRSLLALLPRLKAVVLVGQPAQRAAAAVRSAKPDVRVFASPHPSPLFINNKPGNRDRILTVLCDVATFLKDLDPAV